MMNFKPALFLAVASILVAGPAFAQKEAIGSFYEMQMAPKMCKWTDAGDSKKLDEKVADMEKGLSISASDKASIMKTAEADLKSDPSNCERDGLVGQMYNEAVK
jgi:hypothetical protein